jgi:hypothetical protein
VVAIVEVVVVGPTLVREELGEENPGPDETLESVFAGGDEPGFVVVDPPPPPPPPLDTTVVHTVTVTVASDLVTVTATV